MNKKLEEFMEKVPISSKGIMGRAFAGEGSPRQAIKAMCLSCCHFDRQLIADCRVILCPLNVWRPYQKGSQEDVPSQQDVPEEESDEDHK